MFSPNTGKYGPEKTPHLDYFHAVQLALKHNEVISVPKQERQYREVEKYKLKHINFKTMKKGKCKESFEITLKY